MSIVAALACGLGACTHSARGPESGKGSQASKPRASASSSATGEAVAAYRAMWEDAAEASRTSDPKHPRLDDHAEKSALWLLQYVMQQSRKAGVTSQGAPRTAPTVVKSSRTKVELLDCLDGSKWMKVKPGGQADGMPGGHYRTEATVVRHSSGQWKVSKLYSAEAGSCMT